MRCRSLSVFLVSVLSLCVASGQMRIGLHGGVNFSDVTEPPNYDHAGTWEMQTYGFGGIVADVHLTNHWQFATEVNFIRKGIRLPNSAWGLSLPGTTTLTANYYEVPLKIRYRSETRPLGWYVEGGPSLALLESGRALEVLLPIGGKSYSEEIRAAGGIFRTLQPSLIAGAGAEYELTGALSLVLSASYALGLSDVFENFWPASRSRGGQCDLGVLVSL